MFVMLNQYTVITITPEKNSKVKYYRQIHKMDYMLFVNIINAIF